MAGVVVGRLPWPWASCEVRSANSASSLLAERPGTWLSHHAQRHSFFSPSRQPSEIENVHSTSSTESSDGASIYYV